MNTINITVGLRTRIPIQMIGVQGEKYPSTQINFDLSAFAETYGSSGTALLSHKRNGDSEAYLLNTTQSGSTLTWEITAYDTEYYGVGVASITWETTEGVAKTLDFYTYVSKSVTGSSESGDYPSGGGEDITFTQEEIDGMIENIVSEVYG